MNKARNCGRTDLAGPARHADVQRERRRLGRAAHLRGPGTGGARAASRSAASFCALPSSGAGRVARRRTVTVSENGYVVSTSTVEPSGSSAEAGARIACQPVPG